MGTIKVTLLTEAIVADFLEAAENERGEKEWRRLADFVNDMTRGERSIWVATCDGVYAGMVSVRWESEYPGFRMAPVAAEIIDLYVWQDYRRKGIASRLMSAAEDALEDRDFASAGLLVGIRAEDMPAWQFYLERGYVFDGSGAWWNGARIHTVRTPDLHEAPVLLAMEKSLL